MRHICGAKKKTKTMDMADMTIMDTVVNMDMMSTVMMIMADTMIIMMLTDTTKRTIRYEL